VLVLVAASLVGIAALMVRSEKLTSQELAPELPAEKLPESTGVEPSIQAGQPLRLVLDLRHAAFEIARGEKLHVEASYPEGSYELVEQLERGENGENVYRVTFGRTGSGLLAGLKQLLGGQEPKVRIEVPADVPIALETDLGSGALEGDLGGLWLTSARIHGSQGGIDVTFSDPLREPMERLDVKASMAGFKLSGVGNASPAEFSVDVSMAGAEIDMRGPWSRDARVSIESHMAGTMVRLPRNVRILGIDHGEPRVEAEPEIPLPTLTFEVSTDDRGDLEFVD